MNIALLLIVFVVIIHAKTTRSLLETESVAEVALRRLRTHEEGRISLAADANDDDTLHAIARQRCEKHRYTGPNYYNITIPDRGTHMIVCDKDHIGIRLI